MARITIEDCMKKIDSRFALVHLAIRRVLQLRKGAKPLVDADNREIVLALREIAAGKVTLENIDLLERSIIGETGLPGRELFDQEAIRDSFEEEVKRFGEQGAVAELPEDSFHEEDTSQDEQA